MVGEGRGTLWTTVGRGQNNGHWTADWVVGNGDGWEGSLHEILVKDIVMRHCCGY